MLFGAPELLPLLWLVPGALLLAGFGEWSRRRRRRSWADPELGERLAPGRSGFRRGLRAVLVVGALAFALLAAARPQVGARLVQVEREGVNVLIALDVSLSMEASDVLPSRLQRSQAEIRELFDRLRGNRVGILLFAGSPFLLTPLTVDVAAANLFLDAVDVDVLPDPGTNLEEALRGALQALEDAGSESAGNLVVLFTDGEGHVGDPLEAARQLAEVGIPVVTVGVGTPNGEPIPVLDGAGHLSGYKKDRSGNVVLSRLDEDTLREIASITGGVYFPATLQGREVTDIVDLVARMERGELGGSIRRRVEERFQVPATVSAVFLILAFLVPEARREEKEGKA